MSGNTIYSSCGARDSTAVPSSRAGRPGVLGAEVGPCAGLAPQRSCPLWVERRAAARRRGWGTSGEGAARGRRGSEGTAPWPLGLDAWTKTPVASAHVKGRASGSCSGRPNGSWNSGSARTPGSTSACTRGSRSTASTRSGRPSGSGGVRSRRFMGVGTARRISDECGVQA
jgi:hypothetical protein